jgi:hypothetical protein
VLALSNPYARTVGTVQDMHGRDLQVKVDHDAVVIGAHYTEFPLTRAACEEFAQLFVAACWEAGANAELTRQEEAGESDVP